MTPAEAWDLGYNAVAADAVWSLPPDLRHAFITGYNAFTHGAPNPYRPPEEVKS